MTTQNFFALSLAGNAKTGCPTTTTSKNSCPDTCELKEKGCYAKYSFLGGYWNKLSNGEVKNSLDFKELLHSIKGLKKGALWRHNQAGDLLHNNGVIDKPALKAIVKANKGKRGFTYTHHKPEIGDNALQIDLANEQGFTVNLSTNNLVEADKAFNLEIAPVVTLLAEDAEKVTYTPQGNKVVACPAYKNKGKGDTKKTIQCVDCELCAIPDREYIIGFRAHGTAKKHIELIAKG